MLYVNIEDSRTGSKKRGTFLLRLRSYEMTTVDVHLHEEDVDDHV